MSKALTSRATPELEYLQAKWAAHLPYRQATAMLKEVLPLAKGISFSGTRDRIHALGKGQGRDFERGILAPPHLGAQDSRLASRQMHRDSIAGPAPTNQQNRPWSAAASRGSLMKSTSPGFARSPYRGSPE
ncbi:hypothetical protein [Paraburkholderia sp. BL10I2N1]|uniref:hypothetical protein n=1 Tax=Paraburkholderia sp. BL10I2N1 TaxID=1938796 RepID=UPI00105B94F6|nr:hypothetical protein [Paraburkholderia sp. BL10I2N1]